MDVCRSCHVALVANGHPFLRLLSIMGGGALVEDSSRTAGIAASSGSSSIGQAGAAAPSCEPAAKKPRRVLGRRDSEQHVERAIALHFPHASKTAIEVQRVEGLTLRDRLRRDYRNLKKVSPTKRLGAKYWREMVALYTAREGNVQDLKVLDPKQTVDAGMMLALENAVRANPATRSKDPLASWLAGANTINQRELCGLLKTIAATPQLGKVNIDSIFIEVLKLLVRIDKVEEFKTEIKACSYLFDSALASQYMRLKKAGVSQQTWLLSHRSLARIIIDADDLEQLAGFEGNWVDVGQVLQRVAKSSELGAALFGFALLVLSSELFRKKVDGFLQKVIEKNFSEKAVQEYLNKCDEACEEFQPEMGVATKRKVMLAMFNYSFEVTVVTPMIECELRLWAAMKNQLVGRKGGLPPLKYEQILLGKIATQPALKVSGPLFVEMLASRTTAMELLADERLQCFEDMKRALAQAESTLLSLDRSWKVDADFLNTCAEGALDEICKQKLLDTLPAEGVEVSIGNAEAEAQALRASDLGQWSSNAMQGTMDLFVEVLDKFKRGNAPDDRLGEDFWWQRVLERMSFFMVVKTSSLDGATSKTFMGKAALEYQWKEVRESSKKEPPTLRDLEWFQRLRYLLSREQVVELTSWVTQALGAINGGKPLHVSTASCNEASTPSKAASSSGSGSAKKSVSLLPFFG